MEKNLKEGQSDPFLDQITVLETTHRAQRDEDSAVIEQLEHLSHCLQAANTDLLSDLARVISDNDALVCLDKERRTQLYDSETTCAALRENLCLSESIMKERNSTIVVMSQQIKNLHVSAEESVALHINDVDKSRENETLQASVQYLQNQLEQVSSTFVCSEIH
jgi:hypothetical protein